MRKNTATTRSSRGEQKLHNPNGWEKINPIETSQGEQKTR